MHYRRNSTISKAYSLPLEIMRLIFRFAIECQWYNYRQPLIIAHTCAYWRAAILCPPVVWSQVNLSYLTKSQTSLYRAIFADSPIDCISISGNVRVPEHREWLLSKLPDVAELEIDIVKQVPKSLLHCTRPVAPRLQYLDLQGDQSYDCSPLPFPLFGWSMPNLRHVYLDNILLPLRPGILTNLTTFYLRGRLPISGLRQGSDVDILTVLHDSPNLRTLDFDVQFFNPSSQERAQPLPNIPCHRTAHHKLHTIKLGLPPPVMHHILHALIGCSYLDVKLKADNRDQFVPPLFCPDVVPSSLVQGISRLLVKRDVQTHHFVAVGWDQLGQSQAEPPSFEFTWIDGDTYEVGVLLFGS